MPTIIPFHRVVLDDPAFTDASRSPSTPAGSRPSGPARSSRTARPPTASQPPERERITVEVGGRRLEVSLPAGLAAARRRRGTSRKPPSAHRAAASGAAASGDALTAPMQGTIVKVAVEDGQTVEAGDLVVVLEAMKMEQPINAHQAGTDHRPRPRRSARS